MAKEEIKVRLDARTWVKQTQGKINSTADLETIDALIAQLAKHADVENLAGDFSEIVIILNEGASPNAILRILADNRLPWIVSVQEHSSDNDLKAVAR